MLFMTCTDERLTISLCYGEDKIVPFKITQAGAPLDLTGKRVFMTVRVSAGAATVEIFKVSTAPAEIDITSAVDGELEVIFTDVDTTRTPREYRYDLALDNGAGDDRLILVKNQSLLIQRTVTEWPV